MAIIVKDRKRETETEREGERERTKLDRGVNKIGRSIPFQ